MFNVLYQQVLGFEKLFPELINEFLILKSSPDYAVLLCWELAYLSRFVCVYEYRFEFLWVINSLLADVWSPIKSFDSANWADILLGSFSIWDGYLLWLKGLDWPKHKLIFDRFGIIFDSDGLFIANNS